MEQKDVLQLVWACQKGDSRALERLVIAVQDQVLFHCIRMMHSRADAEDAAQDILIAMIRGLDTLWSPDAFWAWLYRIIANTCNHQLGREKLALLHQQEVEEEMLDSLEELDRSYQPEYLLESEEKRRIIVSLIDGLPEPQRLCVLLYYYNGLSVRDITAILESPEGSVKSRLNYARRSIKRGVDTYTQQGIELYRVFPHRLSCRTSWSRRRPLWPPVVWDMRRWRQRVRPLQEERSP